MVRVTVTVRDTLTEGGGASDHPEDNKGQSELQWLL